MVMFCPLSIDVADGVTAPATNAVFTVIVLTAEVVVTGVVALSVMVTQ
jgi:hypothetical protein